MKNIGILSLLLISGALAYLTINSAVKASYFKEYLLETEKELVDIAALVPANLSPDQIEQIAHKRQIRFRSLAGEEYVSTAPRNTHLVCFYGSLELFFDKDNHLIEMHGPASEKNPVYQWASK